MNIRRASFTNNFFPDVYVLSVDTDINNVDTDINDVSFFITDQMGFVIPRDKADRIVRGLREFYAKYSDEEINKYNQKLLNSKE